MSRERDREIAAYLDDLAARATGAESARLWADTAALLVAEARRESRQHRWCRWCAHPLVFVAVLAGMWAWWLLGDAAGGVPVGPVTLVFRVVCTSAMVAASTSIWYHRRRERRYRAEIADLARNMRGEGGADGGPQ